MPQVLIPYFKYIPIVRKKNPELFLELEIPLKVPPFSTPVEPQKISRGIRIFNLFGDDKI